MSTLHSPVPSANIPVSNYTSAAFADKAVVSTVPVIVKEIRLTNAAGATRYMHLFNAAAVPADGSAPTVMPVAVINGASISYTFPGNGQYFSTGLCWCSSTTQATKTLGGATDIWIEIDYVKAN